MARREQEPAPKTDMIERDLIEQLAQRRAAQAAQAQVAPRPQEYAAPAPAYAPTPEYQAPVARPTAEQSRTIGSLSIGITDTELIGIITKRQGGSQMPVPMAQPAAAPAPQPVPFHAAPQEQAPKRDLSDFDFLQQPSSPTSPNVALAQPITASRADAPLAGLAQVSAVARPAQTIAPTPITSREPAPASTRPDPMEELFGITSKAKNVEEEEEGQQPAARAQKAVRTARVRPERNKPRRFPTMRVALALGLVATSYGLTAHARIDDAVKDNSKPWGAAKEAVLSPANLNPVPGIGYLINMVAEHEAKKDAEK